MVIVIKVFALRENKKEIYTEKAGRLNSDDTLHFH